MCDRHLLLPIRIFVTHSSNLAKLGLQRIAGSPRLMAMAQARAANRISVRLLRESPFHADSGAVPLGLVKIVGKLPVWFDARAGRLLAEPDVDPWPSALVLSGDQVYCDDVAGPMLRAIHALIERLGLFDEHLEGAVVSDSAKLYEHPASYYHRADLLPAVSANASESRQRLPPSVTRSKAMINSTYAVNLGVSAYELDLFGRVRNLSEAALQQYFAVAANRRNAQLSLVAETATAWLTYGADAQRLKIADATLTRVYDALGFLPRA